MKTRHPLNPLRRVTHVTPTTGAYGDHTPIRQTTTVRYQGLDVTIIGELDAGLLAIAGYGTPHERAIAAITVQQFAARRVYRLVAGSSWTPPRQPATDGTAAVTSLDVNPSKYKNRKSPRSETVSDLLILTLRRRHSANTNPVTWPAVTRSTPPPQESTRPTRNKRAVRWYS